MGAWCRRRTTGMAARHSSAGRMLAVAVFVMGFAGAHRAGAQARGADEVAAWAREQVQAAATPLDLPGWSVAYTVTTPAKLTPEEARVLREKIGGLPDHPRRRELEDEERRLTEGPDVDEFVAYLGGAAGYRWNKTRDRSYPTRVRDIAVTPTTSWILSDGQVQVMDPRSPNGNANFPLMTPLLERDSRLFWFGGLFADPARGFKVAGAIREGDGWRVIVAAPSGDRLEARIRWDESEGRGFVERAESRPKDRDGPSFSWSVRNWRKDESVGRWIAGEVEERDANDRSIRLLKLVRIERVTPERIAEITRIPQLNESDAIRGVILASQALDFRPGSTAAVLMTRDGAAFTASPPHVAPPGRGAGLKWVGWGTLAVVIATVIALRIRRTAR